MSRKAGEKDSYYRIRLSHSKPYIGVIRFVRESSIDEFIEELNACIKRGYRSMGAVTISIAWPESDHFFPIMSNINHMQFHGHLPRFSMVDHHLTAEVELCDKCRSLIHIEMP